MFLAHSFKNQVVSGISKRLRSKALVNGLVIISGYFLMLSLNASALEFESEAPIEIASDSAEIDDASGTAIYRGNVEITQGKAKLEASLVVVAAPNQVLTKISAEGSPATFNQEFLDKTNLVQTKGQANSIVYKAEDAMLSFEGDAKVVQNLNSFEGNLIVYDLKERAIKAESGPNQDSRVKIRYLPASFSSEQNTEKEPSSGEIPENTEPDTTQSSKPSDLSSTDLENAKSETTEIKENNAE